MPQISEDEVRAALDRVQDPELSHSLVELGLIREIDIDDDRVHIELQLTTPHCPFAAQIEQSIREALLALDGVNQVSVNRLCMGDA
ncbi:iron-sulfur cluster assembly protein [Thiohalobacter sp. IOR34]|uniref:metal-sulfur cluster assembly factor n=1 Tax=Thiohalobacter sp. IOR34 TaxID=3057176 RepID=UPI0025B067D3|nr:iron-sulfur cluster assembly protein [Thiohalobacter sp. IOR34]WJW75998.1 iron-sulfur cluster assembly protein [Thiohalobacter sp. IOR34]